MNKFKIYLKSILLPLILGGIVGLITSKTMDYETLAKPPLSPPGIIFPIVWSILYTLMGISFAQLEINNLHDNDTKKVYYEQLIVNLSWPIFFFTFKWRLFSILIILLLLLIFQLCLPQLNYQSFLICCSQQNYISVLSELCILSINSWVHPVISQMSLSVTVPLRSMLLMILI